MLVPHRGRLAVSFLPQVLHFRLIFGQVHRRRRILAISAPSGGHKSITERHEALARIELTPVGWVARPVPEPSMLSVYIPSEASMKKAACADLAALPESAVWI